MQAIRQRKIEVEPGWFSCTGWIELAYEDEPNMHEHRECMWLEHDNIRQTAYLDLETGYEYDDQTVEHKQWAHEWAETMRQHWLQYTDWRPTHANKLQ